MSKKLARLSLFALMVGFMSSLFFTTEAFADELDTPADDPIIEEYTVSDYSYSHSYVDLDHNIQGAPVYSDLSNNPYDETYLLSTDIEEFEDYTSDANTFMAVIDLRITRDDNDDFTLYAYNWHTSPNPYASNEIELSSGTHTYRFTFYYSLSHMSNSICFKYKTSDEFVTLKTVSATFTYYNENEIYDYELCQYVLPYETANLTSNGIVY